MTENSPGDPYPSLDQAVRAGQIQIIALVAASLIALALVSILRMTHPAAAGLPARPGPPLLSNLVAPILALTNLLAAWIVPRAVTERGRRAIAQSMSPNTLPTAPEVEGRLLVVHRTQMLIAAALIEGTAFFLAICHVLEGVWWVRLAAAGLIVAVAFQFPTTSSVERWLDDQRERLTEDRSMMT